jgi:hypothetical protein
MTMLNEELNKVGRTAKTDNANVGVTMVSHPLVGLAHLIFILASGSDPQASALLPTPGEPKPSSRPPSTYLIGFIIGLVCGFAPLGYLIADRVLKGALDEPDKPTIIVNLPNGTGAPGDDRYPESNRRAPKFSESRMYGYSTVIDLNDVQQNLQK